jgi:hypothetical protein
MGRLWRDTGLAVLQRTASRWISSLQKGQGRTGGVCTDIEFPPCSRISWQRPIHAVSVAEVKTPPGCWPGSRCAVHRRRLGRRSFQRLHR